MRILAVALLVAVGCAKEPPPPVAAPRPVTVLKLEVVDPARPLLLTGSANTWKETDVAFEVEGRVDFVVEQGTNLAGRWVEGEEVRAEGGVLARLDTRAHRIARDQAQASVEVAKAQIATARVELERVLPAKEQAALAERDRAEAEFVRFERALQERSVSELDVIRARADRDARAAAYEESQANTERKRSEILALKADLKRAEEGLVQAEYDIERCTLYAPFDGEVSAVDIEAGGFAARGRAVAHLVMMDPIKIDLAVSPSTAGRLRVGDVVRIRQPGETEMGYARLYDKATTADPETRTFRVSLMTRNTRARLVFPEGDPRARMPRIDLYMGLIRGDDGHSYVEADRSLRRDDEGFFVWSDPGLTLHAPAPKDHVLHLRKFHVVPGDRYRNFQGLYLMREIRDAGELKEGSIIAADVPDDFKGGPVVVDRPDWSLRPGELVPVYLGVEPPAPGLYLPISAIRPAGEGRGYVFLAADGAARQVDVRLGAGTGELLRVEGEGLQPGVDVIVDQIHFLQDGEPVRVVGRRGMPE